MTHDEDTKRLIMQALEDDLAVNYKEEVGYPECILSIGEKDYINHDGSTTTYPIPIGTKGNFSFIQAQPKTKKTFLISLLSSIYIHEEIPGVSGPCKGHRANKEHVVHFDTEQGKWHAHRVFKRPMLLSNKPIENYHTFALRSLSYKDRVDFIEYYLFDKLDGTNIGLVVIDGIADLIGDANSLEESNAIVQKLMTWSNELQCHIMVVIHSNFGSDKATGHLGSLLYKKAETAIELYKNSVHPSQITVKCKMSRNNAFEDFDFTVNQYGLPKLVEAVYDILKDVKF